MSGDHPYSVRGSRRAALFFATILCLILGTSPVRSQSTAPPSQDRQTSTPYTGDLTIFDSPGREDRLQINRVMDILNIRSGSTVADIGAGSGWFSVRAARRVGDTGSVYAVDINPEAIRFITNRCQKEKILNVQAILGKPDDPLLPAHAIDAVLLLKTYHEVAHPVTLLNNLRAYLKPDARVGVIDRNGSGTDHGVDRSVVIKEASEAGYRLVQQEDFVKGDRMDYFLVFSPKN